MKRPRYRSLILFSLAAAAGSSVRLLMRPAPGDAAVPSARSIPAGPAVATIPADAEAPAVKEVIDQLHAAGTNGDKLLTADALVRKLPAAKLSAACDEALLLPPGDGKAALRLLLVRWAELDGLAAMIWAKEHLWQKNSEEWRIWLSDIAATWFAAQPSAAAEWLARITEEGLRDKWAPLGGWIAADEWIPPGAVVEMARAALPQQTNAGQHFSVADRGQPIAALIRTRADIDQLLELLRAHPPKKYTRGTVQGGGIGIQNSGENTATYYAMAVERAWPRVDPAGFREYAGEQVVGVSGDHLPLAVTIEDCRHSVQPAALAADFFKSYPLQDFYTQELIKLAEAVAENDSARALEFLRGAGARTAPQVIEQFLLKRNPSDWKIVLGALDDLLAPGVRARAMEDCIVRWSNAAPHEAAAFLAGSGWDAARINSIHEMLLSAQ